MPLRPALALLLFLAQALPATGPARLFVYAQPHSDARRWLPVSCGGKPVADLKAGYFFALALEPGRYTCSVPGGVPAALVLESDQTAYLRLEWSQQLDRAPVASLGLRAPELAEREMRFLPHTPANHIHSAAVDPNVFRPAPSLKSRP